MPIKSIIQSTFFDNQAIPTQQPPLLTITGELGAGVGDIADKLAERLGVGCYDYQVLDGIINEARSNHLLVKEMDSRRPNVLSKWINSFYKKGDSAKSEYLAYLVKTVMGIAPMGGVIVGRGAHLILSEYQVLRLKVEAGPKFCAKRVATRKGISPKAAQEMVTKVNKERMKFVADIYDKFPVNASYYDLILSAEVLTAEQIVDVTIAAMKMAGLRTE
ncbi:MAG: cytidylate kinase-like family protein [Magnetococcales bacterium]|nr:cytidylate kinase-like family protein [Magnetococcales bacterium]